MAGILIDVLRGSWLILGQMAPFLLFGFLVAGVLSVCVSPQWIERHLGRPGLGSVLKAALFGVPLPLCSCGVIPVSASIYRHGANRGATTTFLISTPQTGVDSIAVTYALLGPVFAVYRPIAALLSGVLGGTLVQLWESPRQADGAEQPGIARCQAECCNPSGVRSLPWRVLHYGFVVLPRDIGGALLLGILIAGAIAARVDEGQLAAYLGKGIVPILLLMALGVPIYVCATASVPIAAGLIHAGASPGAALAFLIAGPATNAATITTIWKLLGRRTAVLYLVTIAASAIIGGLLLNGIFFWLERVPPHLGAHDHPTAGGGWTGHAWAIVLLTVMILSSNTFARLLAGLKRMGKKDEQLDAAEAGQGLELEVTGMTCSHCAESVRRALAACDGVESVQVDLASRRALVTGDQLDPDQLTAAVIELGYGASLPREGPT